MSDYDFRTLSPIDFEMLVRDLLQEELGIRLESFKVGKDQGIDFRYCPSKDNTVIVQAKRYVDTPFTKLCHMLEHNEMSKIRKLSPSRYVLATSLGLTPQQKDEIVTLCHPYILTPGDVVGREDLNNLLARHSRIERQHFKLWITSIPVFEELLHSKIKNISREELETIREHARYYVQNDSFSRALKILEGFNVCIIAGIPGIGKTILAEMLALHFINLGYDLVRVTSDISEASTLDYTNQKRLFYYDDFLGQTSLIDKLNKNEDQRLLDFIHALHRSKVSKLVLTTREYILNQAKMTYEKLARTQFRLETCIIDLSSYTRRIRSQILYNHLYYSNLSDLFKRDILRSAQYLEVIDHENYNPRIIHFMTDPLRIGAVQPNRYWDAFCSNLNNPVTIWEHAFEQQISQESRNLLLVLATLPWEVFREDAKKAFETFNGDQARSSGRHTNSLDFENALRELEGNFVSTSKSRDRILLSFHNPSIRDFVFRYIILHPEFLRILVDCSAFHEQRSWLWAAFHANQRRLQSVIRPEAIALDTLHDAGDEMFLPSCRIVNYRDSDASTYKKSWLMSFEEKAILIADVAGTIKTIDTMDVFDRAIAAIDVRLRSNQVRQENLAHLLKQAKLSKLLDVGKHAVFLELTKEYLKTGMTWLGEYRAFCEFAELFPELITDGDLIVVKESFRGLTDDPSFGDDSDPDTLRADAEELKLLGGKLNVDVDQDVRRLEERAEQIEEEALETDEDDYDTRKSVKDYEYCSDAEIRSMFATI
ncbi:MAG: hypothetical protein C0399_00665 [Syntrophus sp. (in: bacteria)]|nr:hypothetical protein [Syntrophus sp. (in: bacteria)]